MSIITAIFLNVCYNRHFAFFRYNRHKEVGFMYLALIADVIDSKMVQERLDLQKQVEKTLQKMNELFGDYLASRLYFDLWG